MPVRMIRAMLVLGFGLAGCTGEYSRLPEPTGEWEPANPPQIQPVALAPARSPARVR